VEQTGGSYDALRSYVRADLGTASLGAGDDRVSAFVSVSTTSADKWKGDYDRLSDYPGNHPLLFGQGGLFREADNWHDQLNAKLVAEIGGGRYTAFYDYSDKTESDYMDLSHAVWNDPVFGPRTDYWTEWATAKQFAEYARIGNSLGDVAYYMSGSAMRQDHLGYLRGEWLLHGVALQVTPYLHRGRGAGDWSAPSYGASYSPDPIMFRQSQYSIDRVGATALIGADIGGNELRAGLWLESNEARIRRVRWRLLDYQRGPEVDFGNVLRLDFDRTGETSTALLHASNTNRLMSGRLALTYGVKWLQVGADFRSNGNTPTNGITAPSAPDAARPSMSIPTESGILPQAGATFRLDDAHELFASWSESVAQYPYSPQGGVYNADPSLFSYLADETRPERASTVELGVRVERGATQGSLALYGVDYRNRLISISRCPLTATCAGGFGNVGSVRTYGMEALANVALTEGLGWFASGSYNASTFQDDYVPNPSTPANVVRTKGKDVVDAPRYMLNTSLELDRSGVTASVGARHVAKRYFTYTNDLITEGDAQGFVPDYTLVDASAGYRIPESWIGGRTAFVRLNARNLLNETYVATVGTNLYTTIGDNQTLLTGAPRQLYVTVGFQF
jgi:iron complex outermembrane recepter protein